MKWPPCFVAWDSRRETASPVTCRWSRSCRLRCWRVRDWESSTRKSSVGSAARRAANELGQDVDKVLVWQRYPGKYSAKTPMVSGRDFFVNDLLKEHTGKKVEPVALPSEAPLFLMYSSGTTGKPKGAQHGIAGYLCYVTATSKWILDIHPEDVYWCMADIGWITGHSYIVYGPLANAATSVL